MKLSAGSIRTSDALPKQHGAWQGARCWHPASTVLSAPTAPTEAEDCPTDRQTSTDMLGTHRACSSSRRQKPQKVSLLYFSLRDGSPDACGVPQHRCHTPARSKAEQHKDKTQKFE